MYLCGLCFGRVAIHSHASVSGLWISLATTSPSSRLVFFLSHPSPHPVSGLWTSLATTSPSFRLVFFSPALITPPSFRPVSFNTAAQSTESPKFLFERTTVLQACGDPLARHSVLFVSEFFQYSQPPSLPRAVALSPAVPLRLSHSRVSGV